MRSVLSPPGGGLGTRTLQNFYGAARIDDVAVYHFSFAGKCSPQLAKESGAGGHANAPIDPGFSDRRKFEPNPFLPHPLGSFARWERNDTDLAANIVHNVLPSPRR